MSIPYPSNLWCSNPSLPGRLDRGIQSVAQTHSLTATTLFEESQERVRQMFDKVELSVSSYDTAWVAMVPSPHSSRPRFPRSVDWLLNNQLTNGSWGLPDPHPLLLKDNLSSTLACVLALKKWGKGETQITKGLEYLALNSASLVDDTQHTPVEFYTLFSSMIEQAERLNLTLPLRLADVDIVHRKRKLDLNRGTGSSPEGRSSYLCYVAEAVGSLSNWETVMKYQRKNGSLFNSPSTTAAALIHLEDPGCLSYLESLLTKFGYAVPTVYPLDIYARLCLVENLEKLGVHRHFNEEISTVLDATYRSWLQGDEEIFLDITTCAMAFRLLRSHRYDVSSDALADYAEEEKFHNSLGGHFGDVSDVLELHKASQMVINEGETALENIYSWTSRFLQNRLLNGEMYATILKKRINQEVTDALEIPLNANLEKLVNRRNIEHYDVDGIRIFKSAMRCHNFANKDLLNLAVVDFNHCQIIHQNELKLLERWVMENKLDKLKFARQKLAYCYFSAAAILSDPELTDARLAWAKNGVLTTVVDDLYDVGGSKEEHENLIQLLERPNVDVSNDCCSEQVKIIFSAVRSNIAEIGEKAFTLQGRDVTGHITSIWLDLVRSMFQEAEWSRNQSVPNIAEYMANGFVSFALGPIVLPTLYLIGPKLTEEAVCSVEYQTLFRLMSTCGRLLNDVRTFKRESEEGKLNIVSLHLIQGNSSSNRNAVEEGIYRMIANNRRELLGLVLQAGKVGLVPRACRDLFWKMINVLHYFYMKDDGFSSSHGIVPAIKALLGEPIAVEIKK